MKEKSFEECLNYIPVPSRKIEYVIQEGQVVILQENKGLFNVIAQKLFKKPRISQIHLDEFGNFIWPMLDGHTNIGMIANAIKEKYGEKAEPLYPRVFKYFDILYSYGFVDMITESEIEV